MTFHQFKRSWWCWGLLTAILVACAMLEGWGWYSRWCVGVALFLGYRLVSVRKRMFAAEQIARMPPDERESALRTFPPEERAKLQAEMKKCSEGYGD